MKKKRKKLNKNKKKFFVIITCYVAVFVLTMVTTFATLAWFSGDTHASEELYMGGPVYIYFGDNADKPTSGKDELVVETPPGWNELYPGMNIHFEARCVVQGAEWTHNRPDGNGGSENVVVHATGAIIRAKVRVEVTAPNGDTDTQECKDLYDWVWPQLKEKALADNSNEGEWIFDEIDTEVPENNYFYYAVDNQYYDTADDYLLIGVGGSSEPESVGFLNNAVITLPPIGLTNEHADCQIKFTIVFHALQAFIPYTSDDVGVTDDDIGMPKPLTIENSRKIFTEAFAEIYE